MLRNGEAEDSLALVPLLLFLFLLLRFLLLLLLPFRRLAAAFLPLLMATKRIDALLLLPDRVECPARPSPFGGGMS